jgi:hypothetical protein
MPRRWPALLVAAAALAAVAGCYDTPRPPCAFSCGQGGACPDGYSCRADDWCKRDDLSDDLACGPPRPDGAAPAPDASTDDGGDGGEPADAALFDAPPPDAASADASSLAGQ